MYSIEQGALLVKAARRAIEMNIEGAKKPDIAGLEAELDGFGESVGVFVTLETYPSGELRGCIGYSEPVGPLKKLLVASAVFAAASDPRFSPVSKAELASLTITVSLLSELEQIKGSPERLLHQIVIGKHGVVIQGDGSSGLFLPSVATEQKWDAKRFLEGVCHKAGLGGDAWKERDKKIYRFTTQVFKENAPWGRVVEVG